MITGGRAISRNTSPHIEPSRHQWRVGFSFLSVRELAHPDPIVLGLAGGVDGQLGAAFRLQVGDSDCSGAQNIGKLEIAGLLGNPILRGLIQATS
jgi:hypothetical protein